MCTMFGFNFQESHRIDILRICRHCSCMPSYRRILTFVLPFKIFLRIINVLLLTKCKYIWVLNFVAVNLKQD